MDLKLRDAFERGQIATLSLLSKSKDGIVEFTTVQMAKYYNWQQERTTERENELAARQEEIQRETEIQERTREHKEGMKEAFREKERQEMEERKLQFKNDVKQKAASMFAKLGNLKNIALEKLGAAKDKISDFSAEQVAKYYNWKEERNEIKDAKEFQKYVQQLEKEEIERIKQRTSEHKKGMQEAFSGLEREMYEAKHIENVAKKQELIENLFGSNYEYQEEKGLARAM